MTTVRQTWTLLAVLVALVVIDIGLRGLGPPPDLPLPELSSWSLSDPQAVTLIRDETQIGLARQEDGSWKVDEPFQDRARQGAVITLLNALRRTNLIEARVDTDPDAHAQYGLSGIDPIRVTVKSASGTLLDLYVGRDGPGATTFVRLPGSEDVYRARLGGRGLVDLAPGEWRDPTIMARDPSDVSQIAIRGDDILTFERRSGIEGAGEWSLREDRSLPLDQASVEVLAGALARLEAIEVLPDAPPELDAPDAVVAVGMVDGTSADFRFRRVRGQVMGASGDRAFRVTDGLLQILQRPRDSWRDRTLFRLDASRVTQLTLTEPDAETVIERTEDGWRVARPLGIDIDSDSVDQAARYLSSFQVASWLPAPPGTFEAPTRLVIDAERTWTLETGRRVAGRPGAAPAFHVRNADEPERTGTLGARTWSALRSVWAR